MFSKSNPSPPTVRGCRLFQSEVDSRRHSRSLHGGQRDESFYRAARCEYPGSTYTLNYDPANDQLKGVYFQAVEKQRFAVAFVRMK